MKIVGGIEYFNTIWELMPQAKSTQNNTKMEKMNVSSGQAAPQMKMKENRK